LIFTQSASFSTGFPQFSTDIHRNEPTRESVEFPCFHGSAFIKSFAFKALRPVDNLFPFPGAETAL